MRISVTRHVKKSNDQHSLIYDGNHLVFLI